MHEDNPPDGSWFEMHYGHADAVYIPFWLQREVGEYFELPYPNRMLTNWWNLDQLKIDTIISLAGDISTQQEFELLGEILSDKDEEVAHLIDEVCEASERYAKLVRKLYYQKLKQFNTPQDMCLICEVSKRLATKDVCGSCRAEYQHEEHHIRTHLYRARKAGTPATLTLGQWINILERYNYHCSYCTTGKYEVLEHYIPITLGGGTTEENCVPACRPCNSKKRDEHPEK